MTGLPYPRSCLSSYGKAHLFYTDLVLSLVNGYEYGCQVTIECTKHHVLLHVSLTDFSTDSTIYRLYITLPEVRRSPCTRVHSCQKRKVRP